MGRKSSRRHAFSIVFQKPFYQSFDARAVAKEYITDEKIMMEDAEFVLELVDGVSGHLAEIDLLIDAKPQIEATRVLDEYDVILLGPQVRFIINQIKEAVAGRKTGVGIIDTITYGRMDGEKVLKQILSLMEG